MRDEACVRYSRRLPVFPGLSVPQPESKSSIWNTIGQQHKCGVFVLLAVIHDTFDSGGFPMYSPFNRGKCELSLCRLLLQALAQRLIFPNVVSNRGVVGCSFVYEFGGDHLSHFFHTPSTCLA